ncbi:MAG: hypothetical protein BalsKO_00090 [Balneolaceae bacterium]
MKIFFGISKTYLTFILLFIASPLTAQSIESPNVSVSPKKGFWIESVDGFMGFHVGFRLQQQLVLTTNDGQVEGEALVRRARSIFKGYLFHKKLDYFIQLGKDKGDIVLLNAEYRWKPDRNTKISFGQFFPPVGREFQTTSQNLQLVDRSDVTRFFFTDYDIGIAFRRSFPLSEHFGFKTALAITHGEGKNVSTAPGAWAYMGRFEVLPFGMFNANGDYSESDLYREQTPRLSLGAAYYFNKDAYTKLGSSVWNGMDDNISEYYFDVVFKYRGFSLLSEYIHRSVDNELLITSPTEELFSNKVSGEGFYIQGGKFVSKHVEPTFRISFLNPDDENHDASGKFSRKEKYILGMNYFFIDHNIKFQTQLGFVKEDFLNQNSRTYIEVLSQFSVSF